MVNAASARARALRRWAGRGLAALLLLLLPLLLMLLMRCVCVLDRLQVSLR
jgi:hypothetical protein